MSAAEWRPSSRAIRDLRLGGAALGLAWVTSLVEPHVAATAALATLLVLTGRAWKRARLTEGARVQWKRRAFEVLIRQATITPEQLKWGDPPSAFVRVHFEDWRPAAAPPPLSLRTRPRYREWRAYRYQVSLAGLRVVPARVTLKVPPRSIVNRRKFRQHWNYAMGYPTYPDRPPWRWNWDGLRSVTVGEPFDMPAVVPLPDVTWGLDVIAIGIAEDGTVLWWDMTTIPHALFGGSTRLGKTNLLRLIAWQMLSASAQAIVILDPKGDEYTMFEDLPWDPQWCAGVTVATDDLDRRGLPINLDGVEAAVDAVTLELGRRRMRSKTLERAAARVRWRPVVMIVDEAAELLARETQPDPKDKSPQAELVRNRNRQRDRIERGISMVARLGAKYRIHVVCAAQSPRKEFIPGDAVANMQFRLFVGSADAIELGIIFGKDLPDSPPQQPGYGVWKDSRLGVDPADPFLYFKAYWIDPDYLRTALEPLREAA